MTDQFLEGLSNSAWNLESKNILDLVGCLHKTYRGFGVDLG